MYRIMVEIVIFPVEKNIVLINITSLSYYSCTFSMTRRNKI